MTNASNPTPPQGRVRPSGWWYALVPIIFLLGVGGAIYVAVDEGRDVAESFASLGPDGRGDVQLDAGDTATVMAFWEDGRTTASISRPDATVFVTGPDGDDVTFDAAGADQQTFSFESKSGIDLGTFEASTSGAHEVRVTFAQPGPLAAAGRLDWQAFARDVLRPIGLGAAVSIGLWILLLVLRGTSKRRLREPTVQHPGATPQSGHTTASRGPFV